MEGLDLSLPLRGVGQVTISQTEPQFWEWCPVPEVAYYIYIYIYLGPTRMPRITNLRYFTKGRKTAD